MQPPHHASTRDPRLRHGRRFLAFAVVISSFGWLAACGPSDPLDEVRELQARGRFEDSIEPLRSLLETHKDDPEVDYLYGLALSRTGRPTLALIPLQEAMKSPELVVRAGLELAAGSVNSGNPSAAVEALDRVLEVEPDNTQALVMRASARGYQLRDFEGSLADADRALEIDPDFVDALPVRVVALLGLGRIEEAGVALEELESRFSDESLGLLSNPVFCGARGMFAKEKGELEEAERIYTECLEKFPTSLVLIDAAVELFDAQQRFDRSVEVLRAGLEQMPAERELRLALAMRLPMEEAVELLEEPTQTSNPVEAGYAWADLGGYYAQQGDLATAVEAFEKSVELVGDPTPEHLFTFADALVLAGRYDRALELAETMTVPSHRALVKGRVFLARKEYAAALESFEEGLKTWPQNAVARYLAARSAEGLRDFDRAIVEYRYSLRADASQTDARLRLARLYAAQGADSQALIALRHQVSAAPPDLDMTLLEIEIIGRGGEAEVKLPAWLVARVKEPQLWGRSVAALAAGARAKFGPEISAQVVQNARGLDLTQPHNAPALRSLVSDLAELGQADEGVRLAENAVAAHPDDADLLEVQAYALSRSGADDAVVRPVYEHAIELSPEHARAIAGLARLDAEAGNVTKALAGYDRAAEADPEGVEALRAAAALLSEKGDSLQAEQKLEQLLERDPFDGAAALELTRLRVERNADDPDTVRLAQQAWRFGGGDEARALVERLGGVVPSRAVEAPDLEADPEASS